MNEAGYQSAPCPSNQRRAANARKRDSMQDEACEQSWLADGHPLGASALYSIVTHRGSNRCILPAGDAKKAPFKPPGGKKEGTEAHIQSLKFPAETQLVAMRNEVAIPRKTFAIRFCSASPPGLPKARMQLSLSRVARPTHSSADPKPVGRMSPPTCASQTAAGAEEGGQPRGMMRGSERCGLPSHPAIPPGISGQHDLSDRREV